MNENEREDAYRELGYLSKDEIPKTRIQVEASLKNINEKLVDRRLENFESVKELDPSLIDHGQGTVSLKILNRQIDFHLPSNTFYSHAKGEYGYGIPEQVKKIKAYLLRESNPTIERL